MTDEPDKLSRREQILQSLATLLEENHGERITTARLARHVGVSEAALYRHFTGKENMFDALIDFVETSLFTRINNIMGEEQDADVRLERILTGILVFCERNPGFSRILTSEPLSGETTRLRTRVAQLFDRLEAQFKQVLREIALDGKQPLTEAMSTLAQHPNGAANLLLAVVEGRIGQYVRSEYSRKPTEGWEEQWGVIRRGLFGG